MRLRYLVMAIAVAGLTAGSLWADEEKKAEKGPKRGPEQFFDRLDQNKDGVLTADEVPEKGKERFEHMQKAADKDEDGKVSKEEFIAHAKKMREEHGKRGRRPGGPEMRGRGDRHHGPGMRGPGGPGMRGPGGPGMRGPGGPGMRGPGGPEMRDFPKPDLKKVFSHIDKDDDGKLTEEEFVEGMKAVHARLMRAHMGRPGPGFGPGRGPEALRGRRGDRDKGPDRMGRRGPDRGPEGHHGRRGDRDRGPRDGHFRDGGKGHMSHRRPPRDGEGRRAAMEERFKKADKDGDGKLSKEEAPDRLKDHFEKIDADSDGSLTKEEIKTAIKSHIKERVEKVRKNRAEKKEKKEEKKD